MSPPGHCPCRPPHTCLRRARAHQRVLELRRRSAVGNLPIAGWRCCIFRHASRLNRSAATPRRVRPLNGRVPLPRCPRALLAPRPPHSPPSPPETSSPGQRTLCAHHEDQSRVSGAQLYAEGTRQDMAAASPFPLLLLPSTRADKVSYHKWLGCACPAAARARRVVGRVLVY